MEEPLEIDSPYLLGFLFLKDPSIEQDVSYRVRNNFTLACIPSTDKIHRLISLFNSGDSINAAEFTRIIKKVRGEMISAKRNEKRKGDLEYGRTYR